MDKPEYWVEADMALPLREPRKIKSYSVWHIADGKRVCVGCYSVTRKGGWQVALHLANIMRNDLNGFYGE